MRVSQVRTNVELNSIQRPFSSGLRFFNELENLQIWNQQLKFSPGGLVLEFFIHRTQPGFDPRSLGLEPRLMISLFPITLVLTNITHGIERRDNVHALQRTESVNSLLSMRSGGDIRLIVRLNQTLSKICRQFHVPTIPYHSEFEIMAISSPAPTKIWI